MKITLSKSQWELIGKKTGWIKKAFIYKVDTINNQEVNVDTKDEKYSTDSVESALDIIAKEINAEDEVFINGEKIDTNFVLNKKSTNNALTELMNVFEGQKIPLSITSKKTGDIIIAEGTKITREMLKNLLKEWPNVNIPDSPVKLLIEDRIRSFKK